ncbi:hypothetical protein HHI36_014980 [Cryptolaemus montrouzieri]|uniref:Uncharacterized protein n=1 Tax=Cryptolaemus montrouzieri TaxID=559131 RepID=A0ABD2N4N3_9CUCU
MARRPLIETEFEWYAQHIWDNDQDSNEGLGDDRSDLDDEDKLGPNNQDIENDVIEFEYEILVERVAEQRGETNCLKFADFEAEIAWFLWKRGRASDVEKEIQATKHPLYMPMFLKRMLDRVSHWPVHETTRQRYKLALCKSS